MGLSAMPPELLEKLRRLLAMTVARGCSDNEAAIALKMANNILEKYGLDRAEVEMDASGHMKKDSIKSSYSKPYWMAPWEKELSRVPENLVPVELIFSPTLDNHIRLMFVGAQADGALAIEIYKILREELLKISREEPAGASRRSFLLGCAEVLRDRSGAMKRERERAAKKTDAPVDAGFALVVVKNTDIKAYVKANIPTVPSHRRGPQDFDDIAHQRGRVAGESINLNFGGAIAHKGGA